MGRADKKSKKKSKEENEMDDLAIARKRIMDRLEESRLRMGAGSGGGTNDGIRADDGAGCGAGVDAEKPSEPRSQPNKQIKQKESFGCGNDSGSNDDLIKELSELVKLAKQGKSLSLERAVAMVAEAVKRNLEMSSKVEELEERVVELEEQNNSLRETSNSMIRENKALNERINKLEKAVLLPEYQRSKRGVVIRGLYEDPKDSPGDSKARVQQFLLQTLGVDEETIEHARRVPLSKIAQEKAKELNKPALRPVLIRFHTIYGKNMLFQSLKNLKEKPEYNSVRVANDIPLHLRELNIQLEETARAIRQTEKGMKTRVIFNKDSLLLQVKNTSWDHWVTFSE